MPIETVADRAALFDLNEVAVAATYTPAGGAPIANVPVILDEPDIIPELGHTVGIKLKQVVPLIAIDNLTAVPVKGDRLSLPGVGDFVVKSAVADLTRAVYRLDVDPA